MTIMNPNKIHYFDGKHYLCNQACCTTPSKCTTDIKKVKCLNCLRAIRNGDLLPKE